MVKEKITMNCMHFPTPLTGEVLTPDLIRGKRRGHPANNPLLLAALRAAIHLSRKRGGSEQGEGYDKVENE